MRTAHANALIYKIRIHSTNFMTLVNRLRNERSKWTAIDAGNLTTLPADIQADIPEHTQLFLQTIHQLWALRNEWDSLDAGTAIQDSMIGGDNEGITKTQIAAVIGTTVDTLNTLLNQGHATNLYRLDCPAEELTKENIAAVITTTLDALNSFLAQGHATNMYNISL